MKKTLLLLLLAALYIGSAQAQLPIRQITKKKEVIVTSPAPAPAPPPPPRTPPPPPPPSSNPSVYALSGVVVRVRTGQDNKEGLSQVTLNLYNGTTNKICFQQSSVINAQFDINSEMEYRLAKFTKQDISASLLLSSLQNNGFRFEVSYVPNFFADAWKVQGIVLILEFKDQFGNPHPALNNKVINISNAVGMLDQVHQNMSCFIDNGFNVLNSTIR